jgi:hypothetical protein
MPFKRLHSNASKYEWWLVQVKAGVDKHSTLLGLKTSLTMAQVLGDSVARADPLCDDKCEDWKVIAASP